MGFRTRPDSLRSTDSFEGLLGLCAGRIKGLRTLKDLYINDIPMEDFAGQPALQDFVAEFFNGDPTILEPIKLTFGSSGGAKGVNKPLTNTIGNGTPGPWIVDFIDTPGVDFIDLRFVINLLYLQNKKGVHENSATIEVELLPSGSSTWINPLLDTTAPGYISDGFLLDDINRIFVARSLWDAGGTAWVDQNPGKIVIQGKTTSEYVKEVRIEVPNTGAWANKTWQVRCRLLEKEDFVNGDDKDPIDEKRKITWESISGVSENPLGGTEPWRGLAHLKVRGKASDQLNGIPSVWGIYDLKMVQCPPATVYRPENRQDKTGSQPVYTGAIWDGSTSLQWTTDPAWIVSDLISDGISGISALTPGAQLNKWDALEASKYFSDFVSDGKGGYRPRYSMNLVISEAQSAEELVNYVAGAVGGFAWDEGNGRWRLKVDKPETPVALFTKENISGEFSYSHTDIDQRFNDITGVYRDEDNFYEESRVRVFDQAHIDTYGRRAQSIPLIGCTNRQEAIYRLWLRLLTMTKETHSVSFVTNRQGRLLTPLDVVLIADGDLGYTLPAGSQATADADSNDNRTTGRMVAMNGARTQITLRDTVRLEAGVSYTAHFTVPNPAYRDPEASTQPTSPDWRKPTITISRAITNASGSRGDITVLNLDQALPADVPANAPVAIEAVGLPTLPKQYRVLDLERVDNELVRVSAVEVYTAKWTEAEAVTEDLINSQTSNIFVPPPGLPAEGMFQLQQVAGEQGYRQALFVNWVRPAGVFIDGYRVTYSVNGGPWMTFSERMNDTTVEMLDVAAATYKFRIETLDRRGRTSAPLEGSFEVSAVALQDILRLPPVASLNAVVDYQSEGIFARVSWEGGAAEYDVEYHRIGDPWKPLVRTSGTFADIADLGLGSYEVRVRARTGYAVSTWVVFSFDVVPPTMRASVTGLKLVNGTMNGVVAEFQGTGAEFTWDKYPDSSTQLLSFLDYEVRILSLGGQTLRTEYVTSPSYTYTLDKNREDGTGRSFRIEVRDRGRFGQVSLPASLQATNPAPQLPVLIIDKTFAAVGFDFDPPSDPDFLGYKLWISTTPGFTPGDENLASSGPSQNITYLAQSNTTYCYRYLAYDVFGDGEISSEQAVTTDPNPAAAGDFTPPATPTGLSFTGALVTQPDGTQQARFTATWVENTELDLSQYELAVQEGSGNWVTFVVGKGQAPGTNPRHEFVGKLGTSYTAKVCALDHFGNRSNFTPPATAGAVTDTAAPSVPTSVTALASLRNIFLSWVNATASDLAAVEIWEATTNNSAVATRIATVNAASGRPGGFTRSGLTTGTSYYYWLKSVDSSGNVSGFHAAANAGVSAAPASLVTSDIAVGSIAADRLVAGTITGDLFQTNTSLPATITVGATGVSIGTVETRAQTNAPTMMLRLNQLPDGTASTQQVSIIGVSKDGLAAPTTDGFFFWNGTKYTVARAGADGTHTVVTGTVVAKGFIAYSVGATPFTIAGNARNAAFVWRDDSTGNWRYAASTTDTVGTLFTPDNTMIALGWAQTTATLLDRESINYAFQSQTFDNSKWLKSSVVVSANVIVAPDGTTTADKISESNTTTGYYYVENSVTTPQIGIPYTYSVYVKAAERTKIGIGANGFFSNARFDLVAGTCYYQDTGVVGDIVALPNGWYRCSITFTHTAAVWQTRIFLVDAAGNMSHTGVSGNGFYLWGAQLEEGTSPSSYVATTGASASHPATYAPAAITGGLFGQPVNLVAAAFPSATEGAPSGTTVGDVPAQDVAGWAMPGATTTIDPGKIVISGSTRLTDWRHGSDLTKIDGGDIYANSVSANQISVGSRGLAITGLQFSRAGGTSNTTIQWTAGTISYVDDTGAMKTVNVDAGSFTRSGTTVTYFYWSKDVNPTTISATSLLSTAASATTVRIATFGADSSLAQNYGRTLIDGDQVTTGTLSADRIRSDTTFTQNLYVGNNFMAVNGSYFGSNKGTLRVSDGIRDRVLIGYVDTTNIGIKIVDSDGNIVLSSATKASDILNAYAPNNNTGAGQLLPDVEFTPDRWSIGSNTIARVTGAAIGASWPAAYALSIGPGAYAEVFPIKDGATPQTYTFMQALPGQKIWAGAYFSYSSSPTAAPADGSLRVVIWFYSHTGAYIGTGGSGDPINKAVLPAFRYTSGVAPANAAYCLIGFIRQNSQTTGTWFVSNPYLGYSEPGATQGATFGDSAGNGRNIVGQITPGNASTYIANAAIQNAHIANLSGDKIDANSITTTKLRVLPTTGAALNSDPDFRDPDQWEGNNHGVLPLQQINSDKGYCYAYAPPSSQRSMVTKQIFLLTAGKKYRISCEFYGGQGMYLGWQNETNIVQAFPLGPLTPPANTWTKYSFEITGANNYVRPTALFNYTGSYSGNTYARNIKIEEMVEADLIVDGAISARHLTTGSAVITGTAQIANAVVSTAHIGVAQIDTLRVAGGAITANQVVSGTDTYCPAGVETVFLQTGALTIGDGTYGTGVIDISYTMDSVTSNQIDCGATFRLYVSINGGSYSLVKTLSMGVGTNSGNTLSRLAGILTTVVSGATVTVRATAQPSVIGANFVAGAFYTKDINMTLMGARR